MKSIKYTGFLIAILFTASCSTDWFTPIVDIELPPHKPRLVVYANWQAGSDSLLVFVSRSRSSLDSTPFMVDSIIARQGNFGRNNFVPFDYDTVQGAVVEVFKNNTSIGTLPRSGAGFYALNKVHRVDTVGNVVYKIRVSAPGFETVEASQPSYRFPRLTNLTFKLDGAFYTNPNEIIATPRKGDEFGLEFQDAADEVNYYDVLSAYFEYKDANNAVAYSRTFIPRNIDPIGEYDVLPDPTFNSKSYRWLLWAENRNYNGGRGGPGGGGGGNNFTPKKGDKLTMTVRTFNRDWFLFKKSRSLLNQAQNNIFFSEPVLLHTNVKNGYGIFFINAEKAITVTLP
jgi:hypothetical protein